MTDTAARTSTPASWWPEPGTLEDSEWSRETLRVVEQVARRSGRALYFGYGTEALRDDLTGFLVVEAMKFRQAYEPPSPDLAPSGPLWAWLAALHRAMLTASRWHHNMTTRRQVVAHWRFDQPATDDGATLGELLADRRESVQPEEHLLTLERLTEAVATLEGRRPARLLNHAEAMHRLDRAADAVRREGECREYGCHRQANASRGMCSVCYSRARADGRIGSGETCAREGCERPRYGRGLCERHYASARRARRRATAAPCAVPDCDRRADGSRGMCSRCYQRALAAERRARAS